MYRRGGALRIVLLVAVVVAVSVVNGAAAPLLTAEEMGAVRGGCSSQHYCYPRTCGTHYDCSLDSTGYCTPGVTCKGTETYNRGELVWHCQSLINNGNPCTMGPMTPCGLMATCVCYTPIGTKTAICGTYDPLPGPYVYYPCN